MAAICYAVLVCPSVQGERWVIVNDAVVDISEYMKVTCCTFTRGHSCAACMNTAILSKLLHGSNLYLTKGATRLLC
jgi:hypothetical protein